MNRLYSLGVYIGNYLGYIPHIYWYSLYDYVKCVHEIFMLYIYTTSRCEEYKVVPHIDLWPRV